MESKEYIVNALRTESVPASVEIEKTVLHATLSMAIHASKIADLIKRRIFYGTPIPAEKIMENAALVRNLADYLGGLAANGVDMDNPQPDSEYLELPEQFKDLRLNNINVRLLHAALGCYTESGELLEPVLAQFEGAPLDKVNFGEETGDLEWYQAIGFDETGVSEAECREKNIAKLKARYPDRFDSDKATNRDLTAERAILEGGSK